MKYFFVPLILLFIACSSNNKEEIKKIVSTNNASVEIAKDVEILYSDSAVVKVRIKSPTLKRYREQGESFDEFPDGLLVEFLDNNKRVKSWMKADYALKKENEKKIFVKDNVELYNHKKDKLLTDELIWDEANEEIYTYKYVKIIQPSKGDTSWGIRFRADQEFTRFEMDNYSAIKNVENLAKGLGNEENKKPPGN